MEARAKEKRGRPRKIFKSGIKGAMAKGNLQETDTTDRKKLILGCGAQPPFRNRL